MLKRSVERKKFLKEVINRVVTLVLRERLDIKDLDEGIKSLEWYPVWTRKKDSGKKTIKRIMARNNPSNNFSEVPLNEINYMGLSKCEIFTYLSTSDAKRVKFQKDVP